MNKNILKLLLGIAITFLVGIFLYFYYVNSVKLSSIEYSIDNTPTEVLEMQNQSYAEAIAFERAKKYESALPLYQNSLVEVKDSTQKTQVLLKIALMYEKLGKYKDAVIKFKEIESDASNNNMARAYAVQEIGLMNLYINVNNSQQIIFTETFKDLPFSSFMMKDNLNLTYTKLFEYSAHIYPLGYSTSYVAYGYANELKNILNEATSTPLFNEYKDKIAQNISAADKDILRMKLIPGEDQLVPEVLVRLGRTLNVLASFDSVDLQKAENYFKEGLAYDALLGNKKGSFNRLNYVTFLVEQYGDTKSDVIKELLNPFRVGNDSEIYPNVANFLRDAGFEKISVQKKNQIVFMSQIDQDFKVYLISLGWEGADFLVAE